MMEAIYRGLLYGLIAGFSVFGFLLTISAIYGLIELGTFLLGLHNKYFTPGGLDGGGTD